MKINVFNDVDVRSYQPTSSYPILIRALNPYYQREGIPYPQDYLSRYQAVLDLYVDDVREETEEGRKVFTLFNTQMASQIHKFISEHPFDECVVHCSYGESRSPAIAMGVAHFSNEKDLFEQLKNNPNYRPNELVLDYLLHFDPVSIPMQDIDPTDDSPFRFKTFLKTSGIFFKK